MSTDHQQTRCTICQATSSPVWRRNEDDAVVCLECHTRKKTEDDKAGSIRNSTPSAAASSDNSTTNQAPTSKKRKNNKRSKLDRAGRSSNSPLVNSTSKASYRGRRTITKETVVYI